MAGYTEYHKSRINYFSNPDVIIPATSSPAGKLPYANTAKVIADNRFAMAACGDESRTCEASRPRSVSVTPTLDVSPASPNIARRRRKGEKIYQFNSDGFIECKKSSDCPPKWTDPDCKYIEDDGRRNYHCFQTEHTFSCGDGSENEDLVCLVISEATHCYTDTATGTIHKECSRCLVDNPLSTKQLIKDRKEREKKRKLLERAGVESDDEECHSAGSVKLTILSAITGQGILKLSASKFQCPSDYCQRKKKCCNLAYYRGAFMCPHYC